ncbi:DUF4258 domain-containing protein [Romboutsia hominis]|uniref:DUF4258 domain-containing protein n=1 Tax=Romboutsia hominis TaxID=1507512 RepID=A0A2P2BQ94_9FIRM|nr:DUF4258 domain-containing protein [Romboutsia hominis]CEI72515.1 Domain of unknown function (DUF4258) [Romboutsia hominis]
MIESLAEKIIRKNFEEGNYEITTHAFERMNERMIDIDDVERCVVQGETIEFQKDIDTKDIKVLFQEDTEDIPEFYVVVKASYDMPSIVTVCRTDSEVWECIDNVLRRKERFRR